MLSTGLPIISPDTEPNNFRDNIWPLIMHYESGGLNIPNSQFDPTHTAQGYGQITNTNWRALAPVVGTDLSKYPTAMAAPEDVQMRVAEELYRRRGIQPWAAFNPKLAAAVGWTPTSLAAPAPAPDLGERINNILAQYKTAPRGLVGVGAMAGWEESPWMRLLQFQMIQQLSRQGTHQFVPIDYDPWKFTGGGR